jgi:hypothetical protein
MLHIIYTEAGVLLSKRKWASWREMQDAFPGYKASLGPRAVAETAQFLRDEYSTLRPAAEMQVSALEAGQQETVALTFEDAP